MLLEIRSPSPTLPAELTCDHHTLRESWLRHWTRSFTFCSWGLNLSFVKLESAGSSEMSVPFTKFHGVGSQQTVMLILTTAIASDFTEYSIFIYVVSTHNTCMEVPSRSPRLYLSEGRNWVRTWNRTSFLNFVLGKTSQDGGPCTY